MLIFPFPLQAAGTARLDTPQDFRVKLARLIVALAERQPEQVARYESGPPWLVDAKSAGPNRQTPNRQTHTSNFELGFSVNAIPRWEGKRWNRKVAKSAEKYC